MSVWSVRATGMTRRRCGYSLLMRKARLLSSMRLSRSTKLMPSWVRGAFFRCSSVMPSAGAARLSQTKPGLPLVVEGDLELTLGPPPVSTSRSPRRYFLWSRSRAAWSCFSLITRCSTSTSLRVASVPCSRWASRAAVRSNSLISQSLTRRSPRRCRLPRLGVQVAEQTDSIGDIHRVPSVRLRQTQHVHGWSPVDPACPRLRCRICFGSRRLPAELYLARSEKSAA